MGGNFRNPGQSHGNVAIEVLFPQHQPKMWFSDIDFRRYAVTPRAVMGCDTRRHKTCCPLAFLVEDDVTSTHAPRR